MDFMAFPAAVPSVLLLAGEGTWNVPFISVSNPPPPSEVCRVQGRWLLWPLYSHILSLHLPHGYAPIHGFNFALVDPSLENSSPADICEVNHSQNASPELTLHCQFLVITALRSPSAFSKPKAPVLMHLQVHISNIRRSWQFSMKSSGHMKPIFNHSVVSKTFQTSEFRKAKHKNQTTQKLHVG